MDGQTTNGNTAAESAESQIASGLGARATATAATDASAATAVAPDTAATSTATAGASAGDAAGAGRAGPATEDPLTRAEMQKAIADAVAADRKSRVGENARTAWLTTEGREIPAELHGLIPNTADLRELRSAGQKLENVMQGWVDALVKKGVLKRVDVGGNRGGGTPLAANVEDRRSPEQLIADGLSGGR